ncbi:MAG: GNA1162 family protein [Desulfococcaceae bacterium]|nr:GNA1162 family protein [Desulfococcaceae bacterium]
MVFFSVKKIFLFFGLLLLGGLLNACVSRQPLSCQVLNSAVMQRHYPRSLAVLPFRDLTGNEGIAETVRVSFYNHLSSLPYRDVELHITDLRLRETGLASHEAIAGVSVRKLGKILGCDAVIFGTVYEFQRIFAGFYSSMNIGVSVNIWDTRNGQKIWSDRYTARSHEGGVPITLLDIPLITVRSGLNLTEGVKLQAVEKATRYLAENIPTPRRVRVQKYRAAEYDLQVGAFFEPDRADRFQTQLKSRGFPAFIRKNTDERGELWHRVFVGPYKNRSQALEIKKQLDEVFGSNCFISRNNS